MDVDGLMDLANTAVERVFGKAVTHRRGDTSWTYDADFQERAEALGLGGQVDFDATMPALDARKTALDALGMYPVAGDRVTFSVHSEARTYRIASVHAPAPGSVLMLLAERTAPGGMIAP